MAITLKRNSRNDNETQFQLGFYYSKTTSVGQGEYAIGLAFGFWSFQFEWLK
jgi:hypothetical protein